MAGEYVNSRAGICYSLWNSAHTTLPITKMFKCNSNLIRKSLFVTIQWAINRHLVEMELNGALRINDREENGVSPPTLLFFVFYHLLFVGVTKLNNST